MLSDKNFIDFLKDNSIDDSNEAMLKQIIDEESEKGETEMDTTLIEYCLDRLNRLEAQKKKQNRFIGKPVIKIAAAVAAVVVMITGIFSVTAEYAKTNTYGGLIEYHEDNSVLIHFEECKGKAASYKLLDTQLAQELADSGISPVLLPEALLSDDFAVTDIRMENSESNTNATVNFNYKGNSGFMTISVLQEEFITAREYPIVTKGVKKINVGKVTVFIFRQGEDRCTIAYVDGQTAYAIYIYASYEEAIEIAKTIK